MKVLCLSDLHFRSEAVVDIIDHGRLSPFMPSVTGLVSDLSPDAVVVTGDTVCAEQVRLLSALWAKLIPDGIPVITSLGNHEFWGRTFEVTLNKLKEQICENLGISVQSYDNYIKRYEEFADAVAEGAEECEIHVENALVKRALGYSYKEVTRERKQMVNPETGEVEYKLVVTKSVTKHVVPDVGAQQYYLEHRAPKRWERVPSAYIDSVQINADIKSIADLLNNPSPERKIGDEEL